MRETEALAEQRGIDLANLGQINELIIRRMNTGVLVVDDANRVHLWNESAWALLGNPKSVQRDLGSVAPELSRRLYHWRTTRKVDNTSVALAEDVPEVIPRFTQLASHDDSNVLVFLDDTSLLSRRAEQLTLKQRPGGRRQWRFHRNGWLGGREKRGGQAGTGDHEPRGL